MSDLKYTEEHEWVRMDGDACVIGISDYAQEQLGDIVFVERPEVGKVVAQGDEAAVIESVKAASEIYAPVGGEVVEVNTALADDPAKVNADPTGEGWFIRIKIADPGDLDGLMDVAAYGKFTSAGA